MVEGGTAGLVIASRLAETYSVAIIEAGGLYSIEIGNNSVVPWHALTLKKSASIATEFLRAHLVFTGTLPSDWPEIKYIVLASPGTNSSIIGAISATIEASFSRGNVTITSADIKDPPVVNMGWLTDPADDELTVAAFKCCRQAWASPAIKTLK